MASLRPILIAGQWRASLATESFCATNPRTRQSLDDRYPVSDWRDIDAALASAADAAAVLRDLPGQRIADFLEAHAAAIESRAQELVAAAHQETALPASPRLRDIELPRTTSQLRQAALAARHGSWLRPTIDTKANIRSCLAPIGPVFVIGPSNFPFAFNAISGGDFAAALAAGNPVIAKAHPLHPTTSRLLAEAAHQAATAVGLPAGAVQMLYHLSPEDGLRLPGDGRIAAVAFTGSRASGMKLKSAADAAGKLFFAEMSSINPVVILPQAIRERADAIAQDLVASMLMGSGQFCTNPGLVLLLHSVETEAFIEAAGARLAAAPAGTLFSEAGAVALSGSIDTLQKAGATLLTGGTVGDPACGFCVQNTLLHTTAGRFLENPRIFQTECFGTASLAVVARSQEELIAVIETLEGSLAASVYSASPADDRAYTAVARALRPRVGRLLNDKMPTGVAVSPAMHHGGPFPATTQPHFTAVGVPASLWRFTQLQCWDNVREDRLPPCLRNHNPGQVWRYIDGQWTQADVSP